jgi:hypothetical protein
MNNQMIKPSPVIHILPFSGKNNPFARQTVNIVQPKNKKASGDKSQKIG